MEKKQIKIKTLNQGKPIINHGVEFVKTSKMILLVVDLESKYCVVSATGGGDYPSVFIDSTNDSLHLKKLKRGENPLTLIEFPEYKGWMCWMAEISKYTLSVLLLKQKS